MRFPILPITLLLLTACAPARRTSVSVTEVRDTTHVIVHDTVRVVQVHDSIAFHASEHIREQETTTFDPATGHPIRHQLTRDIDRDLDALIRHLTDSLLAAHDYSASSAHEAEHSAEQEDACGEPALTPVQLFARRVATLICMCFVILLIVIAVRLYHRSSCSSGR